MTDNQEKQYRWAIDTMYSNRESFSKDAVQLEESIRDMNELAKDPKANFSQILKTYEAGSRIAEKLMVYSSQKQDEDTRVTESQQDYQTAFRLAQEFDSAFSFFEPYLLQLPEEEQKALLENPEYERFREWLSRILRRKEHMLSAKEEKILSDLSFLKEAPSQVYYFLTNADMKFPALESLGGEELTNENFVKHEKNSDVSVRKEAFESLYKTYQSFGNTIATAYISNVQALTTEAKLRLFPSSLEMELFRDDVSVHVYDALLESIHNHFDAIHRYYAKKKQLLKLDEQHMYDVYLPLTKGSQKTYTFEEAKELCIASVAPLGEEYGRIYRSAFEDRWMDVYPREGKKGGAYSFGSYESLPFILMNFDGTLNSVFTLAHEMGHSMHSYLTKHTNDYLYYQYSIFAAEVASTFNELLLLDYLKKQAKTEEERRALLDHHLDSFKSTVYRQGMFAEFEKIVHDKVEAHESLTQKDLSEIYLHLNEQYFGDAMISDPFIAQEWMRIPHFYSDFYVYKYATGFTAATILSEKVLHGGEMERANYFRFLKDGGHHFPIEQLKMAGCDLSDPTTVDQALDVFSKLVDELEQVESL